MDFYNIYEEMNKIDDDASLIKTSKKKAVNELFDKPVKRSINIYENDLLDNAKLARYLVNLVEDNNGKILNKSKIHIPEANMYQIWYTAKKKEQEKIKKEVKQISTTEFLRDRSVNTVDGLDALLNSIRVVG